jgi:hypothetical protein
VVLLGTLDESQDSGKGLDGISVSSHHQVRETDIVVCGNVAWNYTREESLLVKFNVIHHLESQGVISQKTMNAQKSNNREVSQHLIEGS